MYVPRGWSSSWLCTYIPRRWGPSWLCTYYIPRGTSSSWLCIYSEGMELIMPLHRCIGTYSEREELIKALLVNLSRTSAAKRKRVVEL
jgi:hypothetical protein